MTQKFEINKRMKKSCEGYIEKLQDRHSKLLALRVDFGYMKEYGQNLSLDEHKRDVKHMLDNRRGKPSLFKHQVGYILKFEHTAEKGPHAHGLLLYDGQKVKKDAHLAGEIGDYWEDVITDGKGVAHNCNKKNDYPRSGLGMIDHTDEAKKAYLINDALSYMLKNEQSIDGVKQNGRERSYIKGVIPKERSAAGRPRLKNAK